MNGYASILSLLITTTFMALANGLLGTLVPLTAKAWQFYPGELGAISSAYFAGMLAGAFIAPWLIRRVGHIRTLTGCMALAAIASLGMIVNVEVFTWVALRFVTGFAFAGVYAAIEAWLQGGATDAIRGRVFAVYSVLQYGGWAIGNQFLGFASATDYTLYSVCAAALCLAILPISLTTQTPPPPPDSPKLDIRGVYKHSPIGFVGVLMIGLANGPHWSLTPVYTSDLGMTVSQVGTFATFLTLGAALFQIPVGRLSDSFDRRKVLAGLLVVSALIETAVAIFGTRLPFEAHYGIAFLLGGTVATQYYVTAAHTNDRTAATQAVQISSTLLLLFCIGAIIGPITASEVMRFVGPSGLFWHNAAVHLTLALFVVYRISLRAPALPAPKETDIPYRPVP